MDVTIYNVFKQCEHITTSSELTYFICISNKTLTVLFNLINVVETIC